MHPIRKKRLTLILFIILGVSTAVALTLFALRQNINLYFTPSEINFEQHQNLTHMRLGGMVMKNSVVKTDKNLEMHFVLSDFNAEIPVYFTGVLPTLFKEGQGVVVDGHLDLEGNFRATTILAKHDEKYMPPKIEKAL